MEEYSIGFDIGSDSINAIVLDQKDKVIYSPKSRMHFGNPIEVLIEIYEEIISKLGFENIKTTAFTGSVGEFIANETKSPFFHDTISIPTGINMINPNANYIFHVGAKDPYFFEREKINAKTKSNRLGAAKKSRGFIPDHGTGTKCGGGSGVLITKQCRRFFETDFQIKLGKDKRKNRKFMQDQLEKIFKKAENTIRKSKKDIDVGGRCGVVIQSDMIHLQNRGENVSNILRGMFKRIAKNYKSDVIGTRNLNPKKKAVATGGIFKNKELAKMFEQELGVKIAVSKDYDKAGAIGAALKAKDIEKKFKPEELTSIAEVEKEKIKMAPKLSSVLDNVRIYDEEKAMAKKEDLVIYKINKKKKIDVLMGIDGGSTTTKAIIADVNNLKIIAEICLYTNGKPLQSAQKLFKQVKKYLGNKINIVGVAYTGSSGEFYHKLFTDLNKSPGKKCIDIVKDEITCHAFGVKHFKDKVDTIFELGGQDAKFTLFNKNGTVKKSKMNLSCMAGTGQTMHNLVEMIGLDIKTTFHEYALRAERTPIVDETCGVFTEAGISKLIALGFPKEEVAAAIAFGFMGGYVNKFIGNEKFGEYASAQGGPFNGKSCLAALALHTGMEIHAFPHRQLFGALGAVIAIHKDINSLKKENVEFESKFRGLSLANMRFEAKVESCSKVIKDSCKTRDCKLQVYKIGKDIICSGGLCPKGNTVSSTKNAPNYVGLYKKILNKHLDKYSVDLDKESEERILVPRSLTFLNEKGVFYTALYNSLGFDVCVSPESDDEIVNQGIAYSHSESCYPIKLAHGHAAFLKKELRKNKDKMLLVNALGFGKEKYKFCPYVSSAGYLIKDALDFDNNEVLMPIMYFDNKNYEIKKYILKDLNRVFGRRFDLEEVKIAVEKAKLAERQFLNEIYMTGGKIVKELKEKNEKIFIGIGRGYTILDDKASSKVHELFASYGLHFIPAFFLKAPNYEINDIVENMYWYQGRNMIRYNLMTALDNGFYAVRETNFNCGTDSIILYHEEDIMRTANKPHLVLQTDGHNSNAQFGTRTLANHEVVKNHEPKKIGLNDFKKKSPQSVLKNKIIGVPYMGDSAYSLAAALNAMGYKAEVMPSYTKESQEFSRKFVSTNTCRPFSFQVGDSLAWLSSLKQRGIDPNKDAALFEPSTRGPCRFGQYYIILRKFFDQNGFRGVVIISPNSDNNYTDLPISQVKLIKLLYLVFGGVFCSDVLIDAILRTRPYEKIKGSTDREYKVLQRELLKIIERGGSTNELTKFMKEAKQRLEALIDKSKKRKPIIIMNGEIYVRSHEKANQNSIRLLEKYDLEVSLSPTIQWVDYVNKCSIFKYKISKDYVKFALSLIKKKVLKRLTSKLYAPFKDFFRGREHHDPEQIINFLENALVYNKLIEGEPGLCIGETYMFLKGKLGEISGIYHVGPFGCMQETAATSKMQSLIQQHRKRAKTMDEKIIPIMHGVFGDSELPNLEAEIAAFAEKCYLKKELREKKIRNQVD